MDLFETERIGDCMNISKFTQKSQEVVQGCEKIAMDHGHQEIGQEHMLSAMMTVDDSLIRKLIEKMYGTGVFYEDAANDLIPTAYAEALKDCDLEIVSRPEINVTQIESGKPFIFTAEVAVKPEVTLGEYKGVEVEKSDVEVTDEDINKEVDKERENNSRTIDVDDRAVESGDIIKLDFDGSVDGVPFEGGKAENYTLTIGSGSFIPGFEDQLIGTKIGEEKDVTVTFPEDYHEKSLAGKEAVFKC